MGLFNIRVYGILINAKNEVLVSDENIRGMLVTKFPGGGLEFGEGTIDCLVREFKEELDLSIQITDHIYTTDFFQISAFNKEHQIISIYYKVKPATEFYIEPLKAPFSFNELQLQQFADTGECETFRYIPLDKLSKDDLSLPIDKVVAEMLVKN